MDVDTIPALLEAASRLAALEQEEMPAMRVRAAIERQEQEAALREELTATARERDNAMGALADVALRVTELESSLADAWAQKHALEDEIRAVHATQAVPGAQTDHVQISDEHGRILQDIAHVGFMRTSPDGRILEANTHAARLCGYASPERLIEASILPEPLRLLADADLSSPARFEVCLQLADGRPPRWVAGARLPAGDDANVTWLLADVSDTQKAGRGDDRPERSTRCSKPWRRSAAPLSKARLQPFVDHARSTPRA